MQNVVPSGIGKTYLAKAIDIKACMDYWVGYFHCWKTDQREEKHHHLFSKGTGKLKANDYERWDISSTDAQTETNLKFRKARMLSLFHQKKKVR